MMSKKNIFKLFATICIVLLMLPLVGGCASETKGPPPEEKSKEIAEELGTAHIKFSTWHVPTSAEVMTVWAPMLEELEKRSNGRITYDTYYGAALGAAPEHYDIVADGLSDMGYFTATFTPGRFPLSDVLSMPIFVGGKDIGVDIGNAMYERILSEEFPDVKILSLNGCIQGFIRTVKPVHKLEDLKGMRIRSPGGMQTYIIEALGAEPVFIPITELYLSLETGVVDGYAACAPMTKAYRTYEVAKYGTLFTCGCVTEGLAMNKDSWNKLPDDLKAIVEEVTSNPFRTSGGLTKERVGEVYDEIVANGVEFIELSADEQERWNALIGEHVVKRWAEEMEAKGLPGKKALLMYKAEVDKNGVTFPAFPPEWEKEVDEYR